MLRFICIKLPQQLKHKASSLTHGHFFSTSSVKPVAELPNSKDPQSLTVSFLQNSCGLSLESAISASQKLNIENLKNPNSVLDLLRTHGLTQTHIRKLISSRPRLLLADLDNILKPNLELFESLGISSTSLAKMLSIANNPRVLESDAYTVVEFFRAHGFRDEQISTLTVKRPLLYLFNAHKILKPKLDFFKSLGFSDLEIAKLLSTQPSILARSLEKHIIPCVQELRQSLGTDENVLKAIKAGYGLIQANVEKVLKPNLSMLISHGVPHSLALKQLFLRSMSKTLWERKVEAYKSFGLSKDEIYLAFKRQPLFMAISEKKIKKSMGFFVNKLKIKPSLISKHPILIQFSLEKRIIPRCSVLQLLISKRLIKEDTRIFQVIRMSENKFVEKLVSKYQSEVPDVVRAHQGKIEFQGFPIDLKQ
jgi:mTERF domain-containing protein